MTHDEFELLKSRITCSISSIDKEHRRMKAMYWRGYVDALSETRQLRRGDWDELRAFIEIRFRG